MERALMRTKPLMDLAAVVLAALLAAAIGSLPVVADFAGAAPVRVG